MNTPAYSLQPVRFFALAGVDAAWLEGDTVVGKFSSDLKPYYGKKAKPLFEEFANWSNTPEQILRFTKLYGPLEESPVAAYKFQFAIANWRTWQEGFRCVWKPTTSLAGFYNDRAQGRGWQLDNYGLSYRAANLLEYLHLSFWGCPKERMKRCARPDCPHPYFVARHLKQNYCSDICAKWGQAQWKRQWWSEHGRDWRHKRQERKKRR
jgi:hypothetical protein